MVKKLSKKEISFKKAQLKSQIKVAKDMLKDARSNVKFEQSQVKANLRDIAKFQTQLKKIK